MAVSTIAKPFDSTWKALTGLTIDTDYTVPSQYKEVYFEGVFSSGQVIGIHIPLPPTGSIRHDSGFYYNATSNGAGAAYLNAARTFHAYKPYFGGSQTNYTSINLFAR